MPVTSNSQTRSGLSLDLQERLARLKHSAARGPPEEEDGGARAYASDSNEDLSGLSLDLQERLARLKHSAARGPTEEEDGGARAYASDSNEDLSEQEEAELLIEQVLEQVELEGRFPSVPRFMRPATCATTSAPTPPVCPNPSGDVESPASPESIPEPTPDSQAGVGPNYDLSVSIYPDVPSPLTQSLNEAREQREGTSPREQESPGTSASHESCQDQTSASVEAAGVDFAVEDKGAAPLMLGSAQIIEDWFAPKPVDTCVDTAFLDDDPEVAAIIAEAMAEVRLEQKKPRRWF